MTSYKCNVCGEPLETIHQEFLNKFYKQLENWTTLDFCSKCNKELDNGLERQHEMNRTTEEEIIS